MIRPLRFLGEYFFREKSRREIFDRQRQFYEKYAGDDLLQVELRHLRKAEVLYLTFSSFIPNVATLASAMYSYATGEFPYLTLATEMFRAYSFCEGNFYRTIKWNVLSDRIGFSEQEAEEAKSDAENWVKVLDKSAAEQRARIGALKQGDVLIDFERGRIESDLRRATAEVEKCDENLRKYTEMMSDACVGKDRITEFECAMYRARADLRILSGVFASLESEIRGMKIKDQEPEDFLEKLDRLKPWEKDPDWWKSPEKYLGEEI